MAQVSNDVGVANLALTKLGQQQINALTDSTRNAKVMDLVYSDVLAEVQSMIPWTCLVTRADLTESDAGTNHSQFAYDYDLASDHLRVLNVEGDETVNFRIEGSVIFTDEGNGTSVNLRYVKLDTTVENWEPLLLRAIVLKLAIDACFLVTNSLQLMQMLQQEFLQVIGMAVRVQMIENKEDNMELVHFLNEQASMLLATRNYVSETAPS
tara:strand:+ start:5088 stop:5717 length:630 start_codon:yes stop_codon:yes gene_type:complete